MCVSNKQIQHRGGDDKRQSACLSMAPAAHCGGLSRHPPPSLPFTKHRPVQVINTTESEEMSVLVLWQVSGQLEKQTRRPT